MPTAKQMLAALYSTKLPETKLPGCSSPTRLLELGDELLHEVLLHATMGEPACLAKMERVATHTLLAAASRAAGIGQVVARHASVPCTPWQLTQLGECGALAWEAAASLGTALAPDSDVQLAMDRAHNLG